jgi:hypothetical protein
MLGGVATFTVNTPIMFNMLFWDRFYYDNI